MASGGDLSFETRAISAFTRVFDALWHAPQDEVARRT